MCIYCGTRKATTRDHIPPASFFPDPKPSNSITVPCCPTCNNDFGRDDEYVRNVITHLDETESHTTIIKDIGRRRDRALNSQHGKKKLRKLLRNSVIIDQYSKAGIYLGKASAFNLDIPIFDRFFDRIARGLLFHETGLQCINYKTEWRKSEYIKESEALPPEFIGFQEFAKRGMIGDGVFKWSAWICPNSIASLWFLTFYEGVLFKVRLTPELDQNTPNQSSSLK
ncbi:MAG: hypothetical protein NTW14_01840 [bacterium]|nr:hypothetical protein [bacterium]